VIPTIIALILAAVLVVREVAARTRERQLLADIEDLRTQVRIGDRLASVGQLVSGLAQDLKSPLQGMLGSAELLAASDPSGTAAAEELRQIRHDVTRAAGIVRHLLSFSETTVLDRRWHDLNQVVARAVQQQRAGGAAADQVTFHGTSRMQLVYIDGRQIEKVIATLLGQTRRGRRPGGAGSVSVTTRRVNTPADHLVIDIDEPGAIDADEAVWSGELDACRRLLEAHGGSLEVEQQAGSLRFHLELPVTEQLENPAT
jgi:signal transduction histidine kinase